MTRRRRQTVAGFFPSMEETEAQVPVAEVLYCYWYLVTPEAFTVNVALLPTETVWLEGCVVMEGLEVSAEIYKLE